MLKLTLTLIHPQVWACQKKKRAFQRVCRQETALLDAAITQMLVRKQECRFPKQVSGAMQDCSGSAHRYLAGHNRSPLLNMKRIQGPVLNGPITRLLAAINAKTPTHCCRYGPMLRHRDAFRQGGSPVRPPCPAQSRYPLPPLGSSQQPHCQRHFPQCC